MVSRYIFSFFVTLFLTAPLFAKNQPNIILIVVDDMGWGDLGIFHQNQRAEAGKPAIQTPKLDQFAREGVQLKRHYTAAPVCAPARASLFSGVHQGHARTVRDNSFDIPLENTHTLASTLKQAGYATALIGKWGLGGGQESGGNPKESSAYPTKRGFDYFFGYLDHISGHRHYPFDDPADKRSPGEINQIWDGAKCITQTLSKCYSTDLLTARAKKWIIDEHKTSPEKPFFLALTFIAPHAALEVPTQAYPQGGGLKGGIQWLGTPGKMINTATGKINSYIYPQYTNKGLPKAAMRHASMITRIDDAVGDIITLLKDLDLDNNTFIVFTSDNGPHNEGSFQGPAQDPSFFQSYGPFDGIKRDALEGGMRVPTLVRWGNNIKPSVSTQASQFQDWMPTFLELADIPCPAMSDGVSLLPSLLNQGKQLPSKIYIEYFYPGHTPAIKDFAPIHQKQQRAQQQVVYLGPYKAIRRDVKSHQYLFDIFDTATDPQETNNLAETPEGKTLQKTLHDSVLQMRRAYDYSHQKRGAFGARPYDKEKIPALAQEPRGEQGLALKFVPKQLSPWPADHAFFQHRAKGTLTQDMNIPAYPNGALLEFSGWIHIPESNDYTFTLQTSPSSLVKTFIHIHDAQLIDADNGYQAGGLANSVSATATTEQNKQKTNIKSIPLAAGWHPITISCSVAPSTKTNKIELFWQSNILVKEPIPASAFKTEL